MMNWLEMWGFILYIYKGLYLTSFLYLVFFAMCAAGHVRWPLLPLYNPRD